MEEIICKFCKRTIRITMGDGRRSNGCFVRFDKDGHAVTASRCNDCKNKLQKIDRKQNKNSSTLRYEKTKSGFLVSLYRNMKSRTCGIVKPHLYKGLSLLPKDDFYSWAESNKRFHMLFKKWEESGYDRRLTPTVDRKDSFKGYEIENMQWLTHAQNSGKPKQRFSNTASHLRRKNHPE